MMRSFVDACIRGNLNAEVDASFHDGMAAQHGLSAVTKATIDPKWICLKEAE
jgi:hypothetical protein